MSTEDDKQTKTTLNADEDFETVSHEDATPNSGKASSRPAGEDLRLQRFDNDLRDVEDDDSDDDEHAMAHHPIFGMLAGRLGQRRRGSTHKYDKLHPENQVLTISNLNDCVEVETAFPEHERCSREKVSFSIGHHTFECLLTTSLV